MLFLHRSTPQVPTQTRWVTAPSHSLSSTPNNALPSSQSSHRQRGVGSQTPESYYPGSPSVDLWKVVPGMREEQTLSKSPPRGSLGAQWQSLWLSSPGLAWMKHPNHSLPVCPPFEFQTPKRDSCLRSWQSGICQHQGTSHGQRTACINQTWPVGTL